MKFSGSSFPSGRDVGLGFVHPTQFQEWNLERLEVPAGIPVSLVGVLGWLWELVCDGGDVWGAGVL